MTFDASINHTSFLTFQSVVRAGSPVLLLVDPPDEPLVGHGQRMRGGELQSQSVHVLHELAGRPSTIGTNQNLLTDQVPILVVEIIGQLGQGLGEDASMVGCDNWLPCFCVSSSLSRPLQR